MENDPTTELSPESIPLGREIYLTPEQIAIAALVDEMDRRILRKWEESK